MNSEEIGVDNNQDYEEDEDIKTTIVEKTRDGRNYLDTFRQIEEEEIERVRKNYNSIYQTTYHVNQQTEEHFKLLSEVSPKLMCENPVSILEHYHRKGKSLIPLDRSGNEYFAQLDRYWNLIARDGTPVIIDEDLPPAPIIDSKAFTQIYEGDLDLRDRTIHLKTKLRRTNEDYIGPTAEEIAYFQIFMEAHDRNVNRLNDICGKLKFIFS